MPGSKRAHSWRWVEVSIHGLLSGCSPAPQLCHFQSIASYGNQHPRDGLKWKAPFVARCSVCNDVTLKKRTSFSQEFSPLCIKLHNMFTFKVKPEWILFFLGGGATLTAKVGLNVMTNYLLQQGGRKAVRLLACELSCCSPSGTRCLLGPLIIHICIYSHLLLLLLLLLLPLLPLCGSVPAGRTGTQGWLWFDQREIRQTS